MSLLGAISDKDLKGKGNVLPPRAYRATVEAAEIRPKGAGKELSGVLGNLRTKDGAVEFEYNGGIFRIGNRKVFFHHWVEYPSDAQDVGRSFIKKMLVSAGIVPMPVKGESVEDSYTDWEALAADVVGREVIVLTKQRTRTAADGEQVTEADVSSYLQP